MNLFDAYKATRSRLASKGFTATALRALALAKADLVRGATYIDSGVAGGTLPPAGERGGRWIERPADYGLRFVGFADELSRIENTGWFTDSHGDGECARGAVYALPTRGGIPVYVEALRTGRERKGDWQDMGAEGGALVFLSDRHKGAAGGYQFDADNDSAVRDAAIGADNEARIYAECERDYQDAYAVGQQAAEKVVEAKMIRDAVRPSLAEMRGLRVDAPSLCATLRRCIAADLERARTLYSEARKTWEAHAGATYQPIKGAFEEGAGASSFAELRK